MLSAATRLPPATQVTRPEQEQVRTGMLDRLANRGAGAASRLWQNLGAWMPGFVSRVNGRGEQFGAMSDEQLRDAADALRVRLCAEGFKPSPVAASFALVREIAHRTLGMRHFDSQIIGGMVLFKGMIAEMDTGEGKTLTATLAAGTAALGGIPVHVITVNDYLTERDASWMAPVYEALGLRVGCIVHGMNPEQRRGAYDCDVTYCTNKEIAFDYLRDWIVLEGRVNSLRLQTEYLYGQEARVRGLVLRGLHFGIVDEADSILIDEARTPLIISKGGGGRHEQAFMEQAVGLAESLVQDADYKIDLGARKVEMTDAGKHRLKEKAAALGPLWTGTVRREEMVQLALTAKELFHRDEQYLVKDGKVQIVDEFTGRVMADRSYERGLHQFIEIKEGCEVTRQPETVARISYQRFFKRYLHLAGMTGTAWEVRRELAGVYGLSVVRVPPYKKRRRLELPGAVYRTEDEKWRAVAEKTRALHEKGRPVLVGTRSVAASERASRHLAQLGLSHQVLNAKQDQEEAQIIARAGEAGCVTIATNMAGRGTDIKILPEVVQKGGLHVLITERHEAARIDRQLAGRCGRLGDPGSYEALLSLEDPILAGGRGGSFAFFARRLAQLGSGVWRWFARHAIVKAQKKVERIHARMRRALLKEDERRGTMLSFSGRPE